MFDDLLKGIEENIDSDNSLTFQDFVRAQVSSILGLTNPTINIALDFKKKEIGLDFDLGETLIGCSLSLKDETLAKIQARFKF